MVTLTRIYTRGGDSGQTSLGRGERVAKHDPRVEAYGTVDEANSVLGLARNAISGTALGGPPYHEADAMLARIQNDLFDLGADLCTPEESARAARRAAKGGCALRIVAAQVARLESEIDRMNAGLRPLDSFILPGGTPAAAYLHLARTIVRRAERLVFALAAEERVNPEAVKYLNRLSDHLFVLGRRLNDNGAKDVLWQPGLTREP